LILAKATVIFTKNIDMVTVKIELDIAAQKLLQNVQIQNRELEQQIEKGIKLAMDNLAKDDAFVDMVRIATEKEVETVFRRAIMGYEFQNRITKVLHEKAGAAIDKYSNDLADKITETLKLQPS